jgi:hypothetical protein
LKIEETWCSATLLALTSNSDLQWSANTLYTGQLPLSQSTAHLQVEGSEAPGLAVQRALDQGGSAALAGRDPGQFAAAVSPEPVVRLVFELLEQPRVKSLAPAPHPHRGVGWLSRGFCDPRG